MLTCEKYPWRDPGVGRGPAAEMADAPKDGGSPMLPIEHAFDVSLLSAIAVGSKLGC